jgi:hypothetical protein
MPMQMPKDRLQMTMMMIAESADKKQIVALLSL